MPTLALHPDLAAWFTLALAAAMFVLFLAETYPPEVTGMAAAALLVLAGDAPRARPRRAPRRR